MSPRAQLGPYFTEKLHPRNLLAQPGVLSASPRPFRNWTSRPQGLCSLLRPSEQGQLLGGTEAGSEGAPATVPGFSGLGGGDVWGRRPRRGPSCEVSALTSYFWRFSFSPNSNFSVSSW